MQIRFGATFLGPFSSSPLFFICCILYGKIYCCILDLTNKFAIWEHPWRSPPPFPPLPVYSHLKTRFAYIQAPGWIVKNTKKECGWRHYCCCILVDILRSQGYAHAAASSHYPLSKGQRVESVPTKSQRSYHNWAQASLDETLHCGDVFNLHTCEVILYLFNPACWSNGVDAPPTHLHDHPDPLCT